MVLGSRAQHALWQPSRTQCARSPALGAGARGEGGPSTDDDASVAVCGRFRRRWYDELLGRLEAGR